MLAMLYKVLCRPTECSILSRYDHSWPGLGILLLEKAFCRPSECSILSQYDHSWPRLVILHSEKAFCRPTEYSILSWHNNFWPRLGILLSEKAFCRPSECSILSWHNHSWPRLVILFSEKAFCRPSECNKGVPSQERLLARPFSNIITGTCADYLIITFLPSMMYIPLSSDWISLPTYWPLMVKMRVSLCSSAFIVLMPTVPISPWLVLLAQDD